MAAPSRPSTQTEWMDNGFPPRSFPVETTRTQEPPVPEAPSVVGPPPPPPVGSRPPGRGRWFAPIAALIALLLLAAVLALATRGDDDDDRVAAGTSSTGADTSALDPTTTVVTPSSLEPVGVTTAAPAPSPAPSVAAPGVLETAQTTLAIPNVDATGPPRSARLTLRNRGTGELSYTTQPSSAALTATPASGTIPAGGTTDLTVALDGSNATTEGPFKGTLSIGGSGGTKVVQVTSTIGRPPRIVDDVGEPCPAGATRCSRQIKLAPVNRNDASPCNTAWAYAVRITDQGQVQAQAVARLGAGRADAVLAAAARSGSQKDIFVSRPMAPVPAGTELRFSIEAVDQLGFGARLAEQVISC